MGNSVRNKNIQTSKIQKIMKLLIALPVLYSTCVQSRPNLDHDTYYDDINLGLESFDININLEDESAESTLNSNGENVLERNNMEAFVFGSVDDLLKKVPEKSQRTTLNDWDLDYIPMDYEAENEGLAGPMGLVPPPPPSDPCEDLIKNSPEDKKCQFNKLELAYYIEEDVRIWYGLWNLCVEIFDHDSCKDKFENLKNCHNLGKQ